MRAIGLLGVLAFTVASALVGARLLRPAGRTRQAPERAMSLAVAGAFSPYAGLGVGGWRIDWPAARWPLAPIAAGWLALRGEPAGSA